MATDHLACARCRRPDLTCTNRVPEGLICSSCWSTATRTVGTCGACDTERLLPGRGTDGAPVCADCGELERDFHCPRCTREWRLVNGICEWCSLADTLTDLIGHGPVDLEPLTRHLLDVERPDSITIWLYSTHVRRILTGLAYGTIPLSHQALDQTQPRRCADHIAGLLTAAGLLPPRDPYLARFDRWVDERLPTTTDPDNQLLLRQFARWALRPSLADAADAGTARSSQVVARTQAITVAGQFLDWLDDTGDGIEHVTQHHLDAWLAEPPTTRFKITRFVTFLADHHGVTHLKTPPEPRRRSAPMSQQQRLDHLRATLDPDAGATDSRTAAMLLLLYAQPFPVLTRLTLSDVKHEGPTTTIRFATDFVDVPAPFDQLLREHVATRAGLNTAANPGSDWLFPGRRAGLPLAEATLEGKVRTLGINLRQAKTAALVDLVTHCPPPIVARMLGYTHATTQRHATAAGNTWNRYPTVHRKSRSARADTMHDRSRDAVVPVRRMRPRPNDGPS